MKIGIVGAGNVGASAAYLLAIQRLAGEIALVDIAADLAKARAIDISQAACVFDLAVRVSGGADYAALADADIVVITAGLARKAGQSRDELASANAAIVANAARETAKYAPNSVIIVVTNPLDLMTFVAFKASGFEAERVVGMAGELDSARLKFEIREASGEAISNLNSVACIGLHGEGMVFPEQTISNLISQASQARLCDEGCKRPLDPSKETIRDLARTEFSGFDISNLNEIKLRAQNGGAKIVSLAGSSAFYAPAAGIVKTCLALGSEEGERLCCCVVADGVAMGREAIVAKGGVKRILTSNLNSAEEAQMRANKAKICAQISNLKL